MRVGINGMGRIGRLALARRHGRRVRGLTDDPRAGNRLEVVHVNELKGGAGGDRASARIRQHPRPLAASAIGCEDDSAIRIGNQRIGFSERADAGRGAWGDLGCDIVLECTGKFLKPEQLQGYFERGVQTGHRRRAREGCGGAQRRGRRQRPSLRPGASTGC